MPDEKDDEARKAERRERVARSRARKKAGAEIVNGGKRPGSGRFKGSANRRTEAAIEKAEASGIMPVDYMLMIMRNADESKSRRDDMAKAVAPYLHPKITAIEFSGNIKMSHEEWLKRLDD